MATKVLFKGYSTKSNVRKLQDIELAKQDLKNHFNTKPLNKNRFNKINFNKKTQFPFIN